MKAKELRDINQNIIFEIEPTCEEDKRMLFQAYQLDESIYIPEIDKWVFPFMTMLVVGITFFYAHPAPVEVVIDCDHFAPGDIVTLKSGGPDMTIELIVGDKAHLVWFPTDDNRYMCSREIYLAPLKKV